MAKSKKKPAMKKKFAAKKPAAKKPAAKKTTKKKIATQKAAPKKSAAKKKTTKAAPKKTAMSKKPTSLAKPFIAKAVVKPVKAINLSGFVTPLDDRVLIQLSAAERMTAGGLYIPDTVSDVSGNLQGRVVSVGRGRRDKKGRIHPMDLRVGDKVVFAQYAGSKLKIQGEDLMILRESEVLGVIR